MKTTKSTFVALLVAVVFFMGGLTSCNQRATKTLSEKNKVQSVKKPDSLYMSRKILANSIHVKAMEEVQKQRSHFVKEALETVNITNETIRAIENGKIKQANVDLEQAIGKAEVVLKKVPNDSLVPIDLSVNTQDLVTSIKQVNDVVKQAKEDMAQGNYQTAADLLNGIKCQIEISTINLPLRTYPTGLKEASALLKKSKSKQAEAVLYGLLHSLEINQTILPLPVLRAREMIFEAQTLFNKKAGKVKIVNLLDNADYQLKLAQAMGYGNFDKGYTGLSNDIHNIKKLVTGGNAKTSAFTRLLQKVDNFKTRLFGKGKVQKQPGFL